MRLRPLPPPRSEPVRFRAKLRNSTGCEPFSVTWWTTEVHQYELIHRWPYGNIERPLASIELSQTYGVWKATSSVWFHGMGYMPFAPADPVRYP